MIDLKYILFFSVFIILSYFYQKIKSEDDENTSAYYYKMVNRYLLTPESLGKNNKPCLWIHIHNDNTIIPNTNQRKWLNFYSRNTRNFNQPYQTLTIKTITDYCGDDFNICLIDDDSFKNIIPDWKIDLEDMSNPLKTRIRSLAICSILNIYGGMFVPSSFICFKSLKSLFYDNLNDKGMFVGEFINRTNLNQNIKQNLLPYTYFIGCEPGNDIMKEFINYQELLISTDLTSEIDFLGKINNWFNTGIDNQKISLIRGGYIGTKDNNNNAIIVDDLISNKIMTLDCCSYGIYVPWDELLMRSSLQWFVYLSKEEVLNADTNISRFLLQTGCF